MKTKRSNALTARVVGRDVEPRVRVWIPAHAAAEGGHTGTMWPVWAMLAAVRYLFCGSVRDYQMHRTCPQARIIKRLPDGFQASRCERCAEELCLTTSARISLDDQALSKFVCGTSADCFEGHNDTSRFDCRDELLAKSICLAIACNESDGKPYSAKGTERGHEGLRLLGGQHPWRGPSCRLGGIASRGGSLVPQLLFPRLLLLTLTLLLESFKPFDSRTGLQHRQRCDPGNKSGDRRGDQQPLIYVTDAFKGVPP